MIFFSLLFIALLSLSLSLSLSHFSPLHLYIILTLVARSISDDLSSGDAARFRDDEYGKSDSASGMGSSSARNESAHKGERDKEKKEKDKEEFEGMGNLGMEISVVFFF